MLRPPIKPLRSRTLNLLLPLSRIMRLVLVILLDIFPFIRGDFSEHHVDVAVPDSSQISNLTFPAHVARPGGGDSEMPRH